MRKTVPILVVLGVCLTLPLSEPVRASRTAGTPETEERAATRLENDLLALTRYRPGYAFWQHVFTIPDGSIAFGSATDGRLLAVFPTRGDWIRDARWIDPSLAGLLRGVTMPRRLDDRRDLVASRLEAVVGPVLHNPTRGLFVLPNVRRYGAFLAEWGTIYERFGVPAELGLAQAMIESGFNGTRRSEAGAIGFCQFKLANWRRLDRQSPHVLEGHNQTTQAPHCAAYLTILATKYGSFIPALSDHHSGGVNVGRVLINGERLGADDVRDRYFQGASLVRDLRQIDPYGYRDIYRTYGPRSYLYSEMVFGNTFNVERLTASTPQVKIHAMRVPRSVRLTDVTRQTGLSVDEVRRFNPALVRQVPAGATLYLPRYVKAFGPDVSFWHRPAPDTFTEVLEDFLALDEAPQRWENRAFEPVLREFQQRFRKTSSEEGTVMATMLGYVMDESFTSTRGEILAEFRESDEVRRLFERGLRERNELHGIEVACVEDAVVQVGGVQRNC